MGIPEVSTDGQNILTTVRAIRTLFEDVSKLLLTADAMMRERGWEARAANTCMADLSKSIQSPQNWVPNVIFRYFRHRDEPGALVAVSVILDDGEQKDRVKEPLLSGIVFDYGHGGAVPDNWEYEYAGWHTWMPSGKDNGESVSIDPAVAWPKDKVQARRVISFALPLVEIRDSAILRDRIVIPLDRIARQHT